MTAFVEAVLHHAFLRNALLTGILASVACGVIGTYVVSRRITYIAGGISHCVLGGIGAALYFQKVHGWQALTPFHGAMASGIAAALIIGFVSLRARQREDTVIGALWAVGMAVGILSISRTPGYSQDLMSYLFGSILMVSDQDLIRIAILDAVIVVSGVLFYHQFLALCFDEEFAKVRGMKVELYYMLLLCLTAMTVVLLVTVVGIVMVIALLTLPVAIATLFSRRLWQVMLLAAVFSIAFSTLGLGVSFQYDLPAGATIIILAGAAYLAVALASGALVRIGIGRRRSERRPPQATTL